MTAPRWRPQVLWIPMGALLGALAGALTGTAVLLGMVLLEVVGTGHLREDLGASIGFVVVLGPWFGGIAGLVVGLVVGLALTFLVGAHLPRDVAQRRAHRLGMVLPPLTMVGPFTVPAAFDGAVDLSMPGAGTWGWLFALAAASWLGGRQARWLAGLGSPRPAAPQRTSSTDLPRRPVS